MESEAESRRTVLAVDADGTTVVYRIVEPDVPLARALEALAVERRDGATASASADALEAMADVHRVAAAGARRFPALRALEP
jgi:hypothetical protein